MQLAPVQVILLSLPQPSAREKTRGISRRIFIGNDSSPRIRQRPCELRRTGERRSDGEGSTRRSPLLYVTAGGRFLRSDDGGQSFRDLQPELLGSVAVDPSDPDVVYVGSWSTGRGIFKSPDGGFTLGQLSVRADISAIILDPERLEVLYAGLRAGRVIRSLDGGRHLPRRR